MFEDQQALEEEHRVQHDVLLQSNVCTEKAYYEVKSVSLPSHLESLVVDDCIKLAALTFWISST